MNVLSLLSYYFVGDLQWMNGVYETLPTILYTILALVGGAGLVYSIILGVNLAKAESDDKRKQASQRLKNTIIGIGILLVLILFINLFLPMILKAIYPTNVFDNKDAYSEWAAAHPQG